MNARNIVTLWIRVMSSFCAMPQYSQEDITETHSNADLNNFLLCTDFSWWMKYASCYVVYRVFKKDEPKALPASMQENRAMMPYGR